MTPAQEQALAHQRSAEAQAAQKRESALRDAAPLLLDAMDYLARAIREVMPHLNDQPMKKALCTEALKWADEVAKKATGDTP